jgi:hypothetical protein
MRTWLRRWLGLEGREDTKVITRLGLDRRVLELESHVDWLHGEVRKLRGRVTGALRSNPAPAGDGDEPVSDAPISVTSGADRQWQLAQLDRDRNHAHAHAIKGAP